MKEFDMDDILDFLCAEPFRPFVIRLKDGRTLEVRRPERLSVGVSRFSYLTPAKETSDGRDKFERIPIASVESISWLNAALV